MNHESLENLVLALVGDSSLADLWWYSPNRAFDMNRPIDVDTQTVREYLITHLSESGGS